MRRLGSPLDEPAPERPLRPCVGARHGGPRARGRDRAAAAGDDRRPPHHRRGARRDPQHQRRVGLGIATFSFDQYLGQAMAKVRAAVARTTRSRRCSTTSTAESPARCCATRCSRRRATWPASITTSTPSKNHCSVRSPPASIERLPTSRDRNSIVAAEIGNDRDLVEASSVEQPVTRRPDPHRSRAPTNRLAAANEVPRSRGA